MQRLPSMTPTTMAISNSIPTATAAPFPPTSQHQHQHQQHHPQQQKLHINPHRTQHHHSSNHFPASKPATSTQQEDILRPRLRPAHKHLRPIRTTHMQDLITPSSAVAAFGFPLFRADNGVVKENENEREKEEGEDVWKEMVRDLVEGTGKVMSVVRGWFAK
ncbi:hypothetical protein M430DRAFT_165901 [Amorphotheca resinae ATCC 22711]|uniref:Uncharacterized protein n=1 Tax=Amorphotheca resinae ATCC 22711 TaxID=857342 RepID=A0A2T3BFX9_AMORE|nr:hypothetical protein M430DRAFT_165901 [Amorphotheca resinae ATCC 22711]PSS28330.1 hypothetical protein M430DRAFT_165901 [Amorphotheca resinae ATCC 22711]